jgi:transcriptional regulator with XRE-family HTH domain
MVDKRSCLLKLATRISELRKAKGLSIHGLANEAGMEYAQVQRILKGKVNIQFTTLIVISKGLDIEPDVLLKGLKF